MKTKIVPCNYVDDLEKEMVNSKNEVVGIEKMSITYTQPADTCSRSDEIQNLTITTQCPDCCDMEDAKKHRGFYFDITIPEGEHWSVDNGDSLKALIEDFKSRLYKINIK